MWRSFLKFFLVKTKLTMCYLESDDDGYHFEHLGNLTVDRDIKCDLENFHIIDFVPKGVCLILRRGSRFVFVESSNQKTLLYIDSIYEKLKEENLSCIVLKEF